MNTPNYKVVLADKLYSIYKKASLPCPLNHKERKAYELLIGNVELEILTNAKQLERCKSSHGLPDEIFEDLYPALLAEKNADLSIEDLSKETLFKLIITKDSENISPPFFNLQNNKITRNYTITHSHDEDRKPLIDYLRARTNFCTLCEQQS